MAWLLIPNNRGWQYDNAPADPGANSPYRPLWEKQTAGVRTNSDGTQVYTKVRKYGSTVDTAGEIARTFWNVKGNDQKFQMEVLIPSGGATFTIPCQDVGVFDATIDWGDGTTTTTTTYNGAGLAHAYAAGTYKIMISGIFPNIHFNNAGDKLRVTKVLNLGHVGWTSFLSAFYGCVNLTQFSAGSSDTSNVTTFAAALAGCTGFTTGHDVGFDTSSAQRFDNFFLSSTFTDLDGIQNWDITSLTTSPANNLKAFMTNGAKLSTSTYDELLVNWEGQDPTNTNNMGNVKFGLSTFTSGSAAETAKGVLTTSVAEGGYGWVITDGGAV